METIHYQPEESQPNREQQEVKYSEVFAAVENRLSEHRAKLQSELFSIIINPQDFPEVESLLNRLINEAETSTEG